MVLVLFATLNFIVVYLLAQILWCWIRFTISLLITSVMCWQRHFSSPRHRSVVAAWSEWEASSHTRRDTESPYNRTAPFPNVVYDVGILRSIRLR